MFPAQCLFARSVAREQDWAIELRKMRNIEYAKNAEQKFRNFHAKYLIKCKKMKDIRKKYKEEATPEMKKKFGFKNDFEVPKIKKAVVNIGIGKFINDSSRVEEISKIVAVITGQKPLMTKAKTSISGFKIREGLQIGIKVTLRNKRMWNFIEKLVGATLPRIKDFRGIKESAIDNSGNLNLGIKEHLIFPEILPEQVKDIFSLEVTIVTDAKDKEKGTALFKALGFPLEIKE